MIAKLTGRVDGTGRNFLIIDVGGVGYQVFASMRTLSRLGDSGAPVSLLIDTHVREDAITLYGFADAAEQQWFRLLTGVQGVGAKAALSILGVTAPDRLGFAIASGDKTAFTRADGVGPKLATRILTELKDKAAKVDLAPGPGPAPAASGDAPGGGGAAGPAGGAEEDAVSALVNLGYARTDAWQAVFNIRQQSNDNGDVTWLIKMALKELAP